MLADGPGREVGTGDEESKATDATHHVAGKRQSVDLLVFECMTHCYVSAAEEKKHQQ